MKKIKGLVLRRLGAEAVIVAESLDLIDFDKIVSLNDSAVYVWDSLNDLDFDSDTVVRLLTDRYDVDVATARKDAGELIDIWLRAGIIEQ